MLATIIVLSILVVLLITYVILVSLQKKKDTDKAYKKGADDLFSAILANGWKKKVNDFNEYNKCVNKGGIIIEDFKFLSLLLKRMNESVYDLKPSIVVLLIGINDFELVENSTPETIYQNISKIVSEIHKNLPDTKIILESLYPVNKSDNLKIDQPRVYYLNIHDLLLDDNKELKIEYTMEGLHVNTFGYHFVTKIIKDKIEEIKHEA